MRVLDLLERADLGLSVVWAEPAMLEREVKGSYILDLPNHGRFLSEGDLVLSAALWHTGEHSAELFVGGLAGSNIAVLVIGRIMLGEIPDYVVRECRAHGIVLLTISPEVSFKSVTQFVDSTLAIDGAQGTSRSIELNRLLLDRLGSGDGVQGALRMLYHEFAIECWVLESSGSVTAAAGTAPSVALTAAVWNRALVSQEPVFVVPGGSGRASTVWSIATGEPAASGAPIGYLVCAGDHRTYTADVSRVVSTLLVVARVELEIANRRREGAVAQASELVSLLVSETLSAGEASARLRLLGADPLEPVVVIAAEVLEEGYPTRAVLEGMTTMVAASGATVIGCEFGLEAIVFVSGQGVTPEGLIATAGPADARQLALLGSRHLRIGVSEPTVSVSGLGQAVTSARARMRAAAGGETVTWATRSTPVSYDALLAMLPENVRTSFGQGLLLPLIEYDARHGSELVTTLQVFLDSGVGWQQAATELHVHVNTLRYRIGRIEALTHRDLTLMRDRVDLFLALASLPRANESPA